MRGRRGNSLRPPGSGTFPKSPGCASCAPAPRRAPASPPRFQAPARALSGRDDCLSQRRPAQWRAPGCGPQGNSAGGCAWHLGHAGGGQVSPPSSLIRRGKGRRLRGQFEAQSGGAGTGPWPETAGAAARGWEANRGRSRTSETGRGVGSTPTFSTRSGRSPLRGPQPRPSRGLVPAGRERPQARVPFLGARTPRTASPRAPMPLGQRGEALRATERPVSPQPASSDSAYLDPKTAAQSGV